MKPTDKWLIDVNAIASSEGWRHPKTNELLKAMKLDIEQPVDETETSEPTSETVDTEQDVTVDETETVEPIVTVDETEVKDTVETKPKTNEDESGKVKTSKTRTKKQK